MDTILTIVESVQYVCMYVGSMYSTWYGIVSVFYFRRHSNYVSYAVQALSCYLSKI